MFIYTYKDIMHIVYNQYVLIYVMIRVIYIDFNLWFIDIDDHSL